VHCFPSAFPSPTNSPPVQFCKSLPPRAIPTLFASDLIKIPGRKWIARNQVAAPTMIAQVHEEPRLDKEADEGMMKEEGSVATKLVEEQKLKGEIVGGTSPEEANKAALRDEGPEVDISATKIRPGPLDLTGVIKDAVPVPPPALETARIIEDLSLITYPEGITRPEQDLNVNSKEGKFM